MPNLGSIINMGYEKRSFICTFADSKRGFLTSFSHYTVKFPCLSNVTNTNKKNTLCGSLKLQLRLQTVTLRR